ncbi:MAG: ABC transporter substrate-binding protein [Nitrospirota bacterium]
MDKKNIYIFSFFLYVVWSIAILYAQELKIETEKVDITKNIDIEGKEIFERGKKYYSNGEEELTIIELEKLVSDFPSSPLINETFFILGRIYHKRREYSKSIYYFKNVLERFPSSEFALTARYELALTYFENGDMKDALPLFEIEVNVTQDNDRKTEIYQIISDIYLADGQYKKGIDSLLKKKELLEDKEKEILLEERIRIIIDKMGEGLLNELIDIYPQEFPGDYILIKLIEMYENRGDYYREEVKLKRFLENFPENSFYIRANYLLESIPVKLKANRFLIGILLPLTGKVSTFSGNMLKGIELAFDEFKEILPEEFAGLVIKDYGDKNIKLIYEMQELINRYSPIAIIGPALSKEVKIIASRAENAKTPTITPSATASDLPMIGKYIFRDSLTNKLQGRFMAEYAVNRLGLKRFAILYPDDLYGKDLMRIFANEINILGGEIIASQSYPPEVTDFRREIIRIKNADIKRQERDNPVIDKEIEEEKEYIPGFDAVFLPGDYNKVGLIAPQLEFFDIKGVSLLGTNGWDSKELIKLGGRFIEGAIFVDGFFLDSSDPEVVKFVDRYRTKYQNDPDIFAAQAYDVMKLILKLLQNGVETGNEMMTSLLNIKEFHGVSGITSFTADGDIEKKLFVIEIKDGRFVEIDQGILPEERDMTESLPPIITQ